MVTIFENGRFIENKHITIDASGYVVKENNLIFKATKFKIFGMSLNPYPKATNRIADEDYTLEIVFQPKN
ncbi:hypothetical protein [Psychroserpens sp. Hel_I_66]|uniref:hypothetical protein n=1 Tax=Psychroserpens sp. Hel_I_66 TaxID=1250004 RepID=UPI0006490920|nr:hypothetical protein [Psychroserpens sp. Hel_I_66]